MNRFKFAIFAALLLGLLTLGYSLGSRVYQNWGRKLIYPATSKETKYPGTGKVTEYIDEHIYIDPGFDGEPFTDNIEDRGDYPEGPNGFKITEIKEQEHLLYTVGVFEGWEDIEGSLDKYIKVRYPESNQVELYRLAFEPSDLFKDNTTSLAVEKVGIKLESNIIDKLDEPGLIELTYGVIEKLIKIGDVVILAPIYDPPELSKKDNDQNYLVSWLILRRVGGKTMLESEIVNLDKL